MSNQSAPSEAYFDRNQAAQLLAVLASAAGWRVGVGSDPAEPNWPVLYVDTPEGQVSWHLPKNELMVDLPSYDGEWDGHSVKEKRQRIARLLERIK